MRKLKIENNLISRFRQLNFEFDLLIHFLASNCFTSVGQQREIEVDEERDELIIAFDLNKFA